MNTLNRVVILDGGMGTSLESDPFNQHLTSTLWSSHLLHAQPAILTQLHQHWVAAGATILGSATYQSSLPLFLPDQPSYSAHDIATAKRTMLSAIDLLTAVTTLANDTPTPTPTLSLGPYGAQLQPAQEYTALYPPPFGPRSPSTFAYPLHAADALPLPLDLVGQSQDSYEDHLAAWHLQRLNDFADAESFDRVPVLAFETVGLLRETRAIRRAVAVFEKMEHAKGEGRKRKEFYVSFVFPLDEEGNPKLPDGECRALPVEEMAERIVEATFGEASSGVEYAPPFGIGINCTSPFHLTPLILALSRSVNSLGARSPILTPWLILCLSSLPSFLTHKSLISPLLLLHQIPTEERSTIPSRAAGQVREWMNASGPSRSCGGWNWPWSRRMTRETRRGRACGSGGAARRAWGRLRN